MTTEPPFLDRYVYLDDKPDRPIPMEGFHRRRTISGRS